MRVFFGLLILLTGVSLNGQQAQLNLIPWPVEVKQGEGSYLLKDQVTFFSDFPKQNQLLLNNYLSDELKKLGLKLVRTEKREGADLVFHMTRMPTSGKPAYTIKVDKHGIELASNFEEPGFHAIQTLLQLIPLEGQKEIPFVEILDHARFEYRGMHFDVCRHFFPVSFIKKYIDWLAYHKLNTFHWHLTDDQGWRIEIEKYPELTKIGAKRNGTIIGRYPGSGNDNIPYGGSYTKEQIKEVVAYARTRFIQVIPEIEMPGHGSAAIAAYPWLSCFPEKPTHIPVNMISAKSAEEQKNGRIKLVQETWGVFDDVFCAGNDSTFIFLQHVIDEVMPLFPSKYFHVGGDECPKTHWKTCPRCQKRMKDHNLKDEHELQSYFIQRIEKYINSKGKTIIGWDEILEGGLAPNAIVMSWQGEKGGIEAAKQNHDVIMTPGNPVYFDHTQTDREDSVTIGGYNPIEKVYAYEPVPAVLTEEQGKHILGAQANLWTEYIKNEKKVEYMLFPRLSALSEVLWSPKAGRNWQHFEKRLIPQFRRYEKWGVNYSKAYLDLRGTVLPDPEHKSVLWKLESNNKNVSINWNKKLDINDPPNPPIFNSYTVPIPVSKTSEYTAWSVENGKRLDNAFTQKFSFNLATGKVITLKDEASDKYPGDGAFTLVNGVINEKGFSRTKEFLGWTGQDCEAVIDLGENKEISFVVVNGLKRRSSWIWESSGAEVFGSGDGVSWYPLGKTTQIEDKQNQKFTMTMAFRKTFARYVKVIVKNYGKIPEGNPGAGSKAWLFLDEIEVQ